MNQGASAIAGDGANLKALTSLATSVKRIPVWIGSRRRNRLSAVTLDALSHSAGLDPWQADMSDLAALFYTGGTTGRPKGDGE